MPASALDTVVTFAGEVLFDRKRPTSTKPEATPSDSVDLRISGQLDYSHTLRLSHFQIEASVGFSNHADDDQRFDHAQKNTEKVAYDPVSHGDSEIHALHNANLEPHDVFQNVEDRVLCPDCFKCQRPGETFWTCGSILQDITEEVKRQAEQRNNSRLIMYVPRLHSLALKKIQKSRWFRNSAE